MSKLAKNSVIYFAADLSVKMGTFLLLPLYTRLISPEQFGNIYLLISVSNFLTILVSLTLNGAISRYYFSCENERIVISMYSSIVKFTFLFCTPTYILIFIFGPLIFKFVNLDFFPYVAITLVTSYLSIFYLQISALLQAKQEAKKMSLITMVSSAVNLAFTVFLVIKLEDKIFAFVLSLLITAGINFVIFIVFSLPYLSFKERDRYLGRYLTYAVSRMPIDLSSWVVSFADRLMIYEMKGEKDTGLYSVGYKIGQAVQLLFMAVNKSYVPFVFEKFTSGEEKELDTIATTAVKLISFYSFISMLIIVFSKEIVLLLDASYADSYIVVILIVLSYLFLSLKLLFQPPMDFKIEFVKIKSVLWIVGALLNIGLNFLLIPKYSMNGAAMATFITYFMMLLPIIYYSNKAIKIRYNLKKIGLVFISSSIYFLLFFVDINAVGFLLKVVSSIAYLFIISKIVNLNLIQLSRQLICKLNLRR